MRAYCYHMTSLIILFLVVSLSAQTTWYVATNGLDTNAGNSWLAPFCTISNGVKYASSGDTVLVSNGLYLITAQILITNGIFLRSVNGPEVTVVRRDDSVSATRIMRINHPGAVVAGFTVTNGHTLWATHGVGLSHGAGVYLEYGLLSNCLVSGNMAEDSCNGGGVWLKTGMVANCVISFNSANNIGGGVYLYGGGGQIRYTEIHNNSVTGVNGGAGVYCQAAPGAAILNCAVYSNTASGHRGGGFYINNCEVTVDCCRVFANRTTTFPDGVAGGGGIWASAPSTGLFLIRNCLIYDNYSAQSGGGIYNYGYGNIENCTIVSNYAANNMGVTGGGGGIAFYPQAVVATYVRNCIVQSNNCAFGATNWLFTSLSAGQTITNCCIGAGKNTTTYYELPPASRGGGNFSDAPLFLNWPQKNFHLHRDSPCINTGTNQPWMIGATDLDGRRRLDWCGGRVDVGCFEYIPRGFLINLR